MSIEHQKLLESYYFDIAKNEKAVNLRQLSEFHFYLRRRLT